METTIQQLNYRQNANEFSRFSGDMNHLERYNFFVASAAVALSTAHRPENTCAVLLDALYSIEQAMFDTSVHASGKSVDEFKVLLRDFETRFYPAMYTVDQRKAMGDYSAFITWRNELNELFFRLRQMGHSVGFDSRAGYNTKDLRKSIKEKLAEPRLNLD